MPRIPSVMYAPLGVDDCMPICVEGGFEVDPPALFLLIFTDPEIAEFYFKSQGAEYTLKQLTGMFEIADYLLDPGWPKELSERCHSVLIDPIDCSVEDVLVMPRIQLAQGISKGWSVPE